MFAFWSGWLIEWAKKKIVNGEKCHKYRISKKQQQHWEQQKMQKKKQNKKKRQRIKLEKKAFKKLKKTILT